MKKISLLFILFLVVTIVVSCGNGSNNNQDKDGVHPTSLNLEDYKGETIEISCYDDFGMYSLDPLRVLTVKFIDEMKELYDINIVVNRSRFTSFSIQKEVLSNIESGTVPTVVYASSDDVATYLKTDAVAKLDKYATNSIYGLGGDEEDSYGFVDSYFLDGKKYDKDKTLYTLPFLVNASVLYYNVDLFEKYNWEVPTTYSDVIIICERWKNTDEYKQILNENKTSVGLGFDEATKFTNNLIKQCGSEFSNFDNNGNGKFLFNNTSTRRALEWLVSEFNKGNISTEKYLDCEYVSDAFVEQRIPMAIGSSTGANYYVNDYKMFKTGVALYPQMDDDLESKKFANHSSINLILLKQDSKIKELIGWLYIKYITNDESCMYWSIDRWYIPTRKATLTSLEFEDFINDGEYDTNKEAIKVGIKQNNYLFSDATFYTKNSVSDELNLLLDHILYDQSTYTVSKALEEVFKNLNDN